MGNIIFGVDTSGIDAYTDVVSGFIDAIESPQVQDEYLDTLMDETRRQFMIHTMAHNRLNLGDIQHVFEWPSQVMGVATSATSDVPLFEVHNEERGVYKAITFNYLPSRVPVPLPNPDRYGFNSKYIEGMKRHVFTQKALVMETSNSVHISSRTAGKKIFIPDSRVARGFRMLESGNPNPGGPAATGGFARWWTNWFNTVAVDIANKDSMKTAQTLAETGRTLIRHAAGTTINGKKVGGQFAAGKVVSYAYDNATRRNAKLATEKALINRRIDV